MYILFIDDQQERHDLVEKKLGKDHTVLHAFDYDEAISIMRADIQLGLVMFDRDLGDIRYVEGKKIERTGHTAIKFMQDSIPQKKWPPMAVVHSHNSEAKYMAEDLYKMGIRTTWVPFSGQLISSLAQELVPQ